MGQPLTIARLGRRTDAAAMNIREAHGETGIPPLPALRALAGKVGHIFDRGAKTGWADQGAVAARQASLGDRLPSWMLEISLQKRLYIARVARPICLATLSEIAWAASISGLLDSADAISPANSIPFAEPISTTK